LTLTVSFKSFQMLKLMFDLPLHDVCFICMMIFLVSIICIKLYKSTCLFILTCVHMYVRMNVGIHVGMCIRMYVFMYLRAINAIRANKQKKSSTANLHQTLLNFSHIQLVCLALVWRPISLSSWCSQYFSCSTIQTIQDLVHPITTQLRKNQPEPIPC